METWVGADWDRDKCVVEAEVEGQVSRATVQRTPEAVARYVAQLGSGDVIVGIEAGDPLWVTLWERAGATVHVFDATKAKRFAQSLNANGSSDDNRSATSLRCQVKSEAHRAHANAVVPAELRGLDRYVSTADMLSTEVTRYSNRLRGLLRQVHPALENELKSLESVRFLQMLHETPTPSAWNELDAAQQENALRTLRAPLATRLRAVLGEVWTHFDTLEEQAARAEVRAVVRLLQCAVQAKREASAQLERAAATTPCTSPVCGVPGIGPFLGVGALLALASSGDNRDGAAVRMGVAPVTHRSGTRGDQAPSVRLRRGAPRIAKKIGYLVAVQLVARHDWAKAQYAHYKAKGVPTAGAYRRVARSFSRVLHALVRDATAFDPERYLAGLRAKGVPWALAIEQ